MNADRELDIRILYEGMEYSGDLWWAGHRNGSTGLANPDTRDIYEFKAVVDWTDTQLAREPKFLANDIRFAVDYGAHQGW